MRKFYNLTLYIPSKYSSFGQRKASPFPDTADIVAVRRLIVVVRVAIVQVHVPSIRTAVLRKRPKVIGRLNFPLPT